MFCKTCGSLLVLEKNQYGKWMACPHGHPQPELNTTSTPIALKNISSGKKVEVIDDKNHLAVHQHKCSKCGYEWAELIEISANYSDEDNITG
jgi:DNA-directed RNA polymerase subunit M/transcription elongation factor TFIIS